jgi:lipopolysaccharide biosynthesis glycosyltransferase
MNLCFAFSPNWIAYVQQEMFSLFSTNQGNMKVYLLTDHLEEFHLHKCQRICDYFGIRCKFEYINMKDICDSFMFSDINTRSRFGKYAIYRLFITHVIPEDKVLYLDADTLVVGNISDFYNVELGEKLLAGCVDGGLPEGYKASVDMYENDLYFNSGVLLMNNNKLKKI